MSQIYTDDVFTTTGVVQTQMGNIEDNFAALKSSFSGATAPSNPIAGMWWFDTTSNILKLRNEANNAWQSVWNFASNKPVITNLSNEITGAMIAASAKDPAAGTAGLRTLGTTSIKACAGNDSRLSDTRSPADGSVTTAKLANNAVSLAKIEHGSVMLPFFATDNSTVLSSQAGTYTTTIQFKVYIPAGATVIRMACRIQSSVSLNTAYARFGVGTSYSSGCSKYGTGYTWYTTCTLNVAALSGWYDLKIQQYTGSTSYYSNLQGYSFVWE